MLQFVLLALVCVGIGAIVKGIYIKGFRDGQEATNDGEVDS